MKNLATKIKKRYMAWTLLSKFMIIFAILIFIPTMVLCYSFLATVNDNLYQRYLDKEQAVLEDAFYNLEASVEKVEGINGTFQIYDTVLNYLEGYYPRAADQVYVYNKSIYGIFQTTLRTNPQVEAIEVYTPNDKLIKIPPFIFNKKDLSNYEELESLGVKGGKWYIDVTNSQGTSSYYSKLYTENYSQELGIIKVDVDLEQLLDSINHHLYTYMLISDSRNNLLLYDGEEMRKIIPSGVEKLHGDNKEDVMLNAHMNIGDYQVEMVAYIKKSYAKDELIKAIVSIGMLLIILGCFYMAIYVMIIKRIKRLKRHLTVMENNNLRPIERIGSMDEIGYTMFTFNQMTAQINNLINEVYKKEIRNKETMYYALEAQIKPHFLYNTLESIRMIAEENCDYDVADSLYSLGHMLRYTLTGESETSLQDEINYAREYLNLYKNKMKSTFTYSESIQVDDLNIPCPRHIIQPIIENAINHGFMNKSGHCTIHLHVKREDELLLIQIRDNGGGLSSDNIRTINAGFNKSTLGQVLSSNESIGLDNVNDRIKMFYGDESGLYLQHNEEGSGLTTVIQITGQ